MKLQQCKELAEACGLTTWKEALANVEIHAMNMFPYSQIDGQIEELKKEFDESGFDINQEIE